LRKWFFIATIAKRLTKKQIEKGSEIDNKTKESKAKSE